MHFPRYWARGESQGFFCWRWSDESYEQAMGEATDAALALADVFLVGDGPVNRYGYGDRPLRELVLHEMRDAAGQVTAAVTRNAYGCDVLNTVSAMFVDIDLDEKKPHVESALSRISSWTQSVPGFNWRVYRTRAGLRLLATHALFDSRDPFCQWVFQTLGADPLYGRLCETQQCFRARLTPKPWRCDSGQPVWRWPFLDQRAEQLYRDWEAEYRVRSNPYATCQLLPDIGTGVVTPELYALITLHDNVSRATSGLPLA